MPSHVVDFNARNKSLTAKLLQQGYRYHKLRKTFSKFYRRHYELVSKFNVGLKTLLHQGLSEPEFYGDLVYKFKKIVGRADFSDQFRKIIVRYKRIGYNINIMRQSACLVFNPITVNNFASLFNCTPNNSRIIEKLNNSNNSAHAPCRSFRCTVKLYTSNNAAQVRSTSFRGTVKLYNSSYSTHDSRRSVRGL